MGECECLLVQEVDHPGRVLEWALSGVLSLSLSMSLSLEMSLKTCSSGQLKHCDGIHAFL